MARRWYLYYICIKVQAFCLKCRLLNVLSYTSYYFLYQNPAVNLWTTLCHSWKHSSSEKGCHKDCIPHWNHIFHSNCIKNDSLEYVRMPLAIALLCYLISSLEPVVIVNSMIFWWNFDVKSEFRFPKIPSPNWWLSDKSLWPDRSYFAIGEFGEQHAWTQCLIVQFVPRAMHKVHPLVYSWHIEVEIVYRYKPVDLIVCVSVCPYSSFTVVLLIHLIFHTYITMWRG